MTTILHAVRPHHIFQHLFGNTFGVAIGTGCILIRHRFGNRQRLRLPVNRTGRRKHDLSATDRRHAAQHPHQTVEVIAIIVQRFGHRFVDRLVGRKMDNGRDIGMTVEQLHAGRFIRQINVFEQWPHARYGLNGIQDPFVGVIQIVGDNDLIAFFHQGHRRMRTDITRTARYQYLFHICRF